MSSTQSRYRFWLKYAAGAVAMAGAGFALHMHGCFAAVGSFLGSKGLTLYASTLSAKLAGGGIFLWGSLGGSVLLAASAVAWTYYLSKAIYNRTNQAGVSQDKDDANNIVKANGTGKSNPKSAKNVANPKPNNKNEAENDSGKTDKEKYKQKIKNTLRHVKEIEKDLIQCKGILKTLDNLLDQAQNAHFENNGKLSANDQPPRNKLQILQWKEKNLRKIVATPQRNERAALKRIIEQKADRKLSTPSRKGFRL